MVTVRDFKRWLANADDDSIVTVNNSELIELDNIIGNYINISFYDDSDATAIEIASLQEKVFEAIDRLNYIKVTANYMKLDLEELLESFFAVNGVVDKLGSYNLVEIRELLAKLKEEDKDEFILKCSINLPSLLNDIRSIITENL